MRIGDILVAAKVVTATDVHAALRRQAEHGGRLGENLVAIGAADPDDLERFLNGVPAAPLNVADTGLSETELLTLIIKLMYVSSLKTTSEIAGAIRLPRYLVVQLVELAAGRGLLSAAGTLGPSALSDSRYNLSDSGRRLAAEALALSQYAGPAPVTFAAFKSRILVQKLTNELVTFARIQEAFSGLTVADAFIERIGPAINSGRAILLYGPPGNGKTSIALRVARVFSEIVYLPYAVMIDGSVMRVFDQSVHKAITVEQDADSAQAVPSMRREALDTRWVPCQRPFVVAGGELTLEMLDLRYDAASGVYEAPLHVKACGGCLVIDDFGRQLVSPTALLNRWVVPLESRMEFLKLHTGKTVSLPFEALVIFSTNLEPEDLMDPAFLRRIPYKIEIPGPSRKEFGRIFQSVARENGLTLSAEVFDAIVTELAEKKQMELAHYQPKFIIEQVVSACRFAGIKPCFEPRFLEYAIANLRVNRPDAEGSPRTTLARVA